MDLLADKLRGTEMTRRTFAWPDSKTGKQTMRHDNENNPPEANQTRLTHTRKEQAFEGKGTQCNKAY